MVHVTIDFLLTSPSGDPSSILNTQYACMTSRTMLTKSWLPRTPSQHATVRTSVRPSVRPSIVSAVSRLTRRTIFRTPHASPTYWPRSMAGGAMTTTIDHRGKRRRNADIGYTADTAANKEYLHWLGDVARRRQTPLPRTVAKQTRAGRCCRCRCLTGSRGLSVEIMRQADIFMYIWAPLRSEQLDARDRYYQLQHPVTLSFVRSFVRGLVRPLQNPLNPPCCLPLSFQCRIRSSRRCHDDVRVCAPRSRTAWFCHTAALQQ